MSILRCIATRGGRIEEDVGHFIELFRCVRQIGHCHSFQFRLGATQPHDLVSTRVFGQHLARDHAPRVLLGGRPCKPVPLLDIYRLKFEVFASLGWVLFYIGAVCVFTAGEELVFLSTHTASNPGTGHQLGPDQGVQRASPGSRHLERDQGGLVPDRFHAMWPRSLQHFSPEVGDGQGDWRQEIGRSTLSQIQRDG